MDEKYQKLIQALTTLEKTVNVVKLFIQKEKSYNSELNYEEEYKMYRDSTIQRFKYSTDLF